MAISLSSAKTAASAITVPTLVFSSSSAALLLSLILLLLSPSSPSCHTPTLLDRAPIARSSSFGGLQISTTPEGIQWLKSQILQNSLPDPPPTPEAWHELRKRINPRTREQQLEDLRRYKGISHYETDAKARTVLPCFEDLLVEELHSNYGDLWVGGCDVFELHPLSIYPLQIKFLKLAVVHSVSISTSFHILTLLAFIVLNMMIFL